MDVICSSDFSGNYVKILWLLVKDCSYDWSLTVVMKNKSTGQSFTIEMFAQVVFTECDCEIGEDQELFLTFTKIRPNSATN